MEMQGHEETASEQSGRNLPLQAEQNLTRGKKSGQWL